MVRNNSPLTAIASLVTASLVAAGLALSLPSYAYGDTHHDVRHASATSAQIRQAAQNKSHYDATNGPIRLTGTIVREERTTKDTGMGWSSVVYWLVFDNSVRITYNDFLGSPTTNSFSRIAVYALEQYGDDADRGMSSITDSYWQPYVGKKVTVKGVPFDTGNAHTYGYANLKDARVVSRKSAKRVAINFIRALYDDWQFEDGAFRMNSKDYVDRCTRYVAKGSNLYDELIDSRTDYTSRFFKGAAFCIVGKPSATKLSSRTYRVSVRYIWTQNNVTQEMYEEMKNDVWRDDWKITVNKKGKVIKAEKV